MLNKHSNWLKTDLHIHSWMSNEYKKNDFKGCNNLENYLSQLQEKIENESLNIISITDHNIFNTQLYIKLNEIREHEETNWNYIPGIEIDILDSEIQESKFHLLLFLNIQDLDILEKINKELIKTKGGNIDEQDTWRLIEIYDIIRKFDISDVMYIPHYNNKSTSISVPIVIEQKNPLAIFNAFEDGNNCNGLSKSINSYLNHGIADFPTVAFSDWHGTDVEETKTSILGNVNFPFESCKLAFNDPYVRVSLDNIEGMREINNPELYIKSIKFGKQPVNIMLSSSQNTIIGGFGSGKSMLSSYIKGDVDKIEGKYKMFKSQFEQFQIVLSDGNTFNSISELKSNLPSTVNLIELDQGNALYQTDILNEEIKKYLEDKINIKFPEYKIENLKNLMDMKNDAYYETLNESIESLTAIDTNKINLSMLQNKTNLYNINRCNVNVKCANEITIGLDIAKVNLDNYDDFKFLNEEQNLSYTYKLHSEDFDEKLNQIKHINNIITKKVSNVDERINGYDDLLRSKNSSYQIQIESIASIKQNIKKYVTAVSELTKMCNTIEEITKYETYNNEADSPAKLQVLPGFHTNAYLEKIDIFQYKNIKDCTLKSGYRTASFLHGILKTCSSNDEFHNKKQLSYNIKSYVEKELLPLYSVNYTILENDESILTKSPGGRAIMLVKLVMEQVKAKNKTGMLNILMIDQPEDQLDNKHIYRIIVNKIREYKKEINNLQIIFVTHNANIAISADSENVIIANKDNDVISYKYSGLENPQFVTDIADILEGGKEALEQRGIKLGVKYKKMKWGNNAN